MLTKHSHDDDSRLDDHRERFSDEVTKKKIDRHLSDINDVITEQDIKNVKTDITEIENTDYTDEVTVEDVNASALPELNGKRKEESDAAATIS